MEIIGIIGMLSTLVIVSYVVYIMSKSHNSTS